MKLALLVLALPTLSFAQFGAPPITAPAAMAAPAAQKQDIQKQDKMNKLMVDTTMGLTAMYMARRQLKPCFDALTSNDNIISEPDSLTMAFDYKSKTTQPVFTHIDGKTITVSTATATTTIDGKSCNMSPKTTFDAVADLIYKSKADYEEDKKDLIEDTSDMMEELKSAPKNRRDGLIRAITDRRHDLTQLESDYKHSLQTCSDSGLSKISSAAGDVLKQISNGNASQGATSQSGADGQQH